MVDAISEGAYGDELSLETSYYDELQQTQIWRGREVTTSPNNNESLIHLIKGKAGIEAHEDKDGNKEIKADVTVKNDEGNKSITVEGKVTQDKGGEVKTEMKIRAEVEW